MGLGQTIEKTFLGELITVIQAEVLIILRCMENLIERGRHNNRIYICSGSRAAINALTKNHYKIIYIVWGQKPALEV